MFFFRLFLVHFWSFLLEKFLFFPVRNFDQFHEDNRKKKPHDHIMTRVKLCAVCSHSPSNQAGFAASSPTQNLDTLATKLETTTGVIIAT